jgi:hypothetical protein
MSIKTLEQLVICHIDCSIWSGRKKLRPEDFRLGDGSQLPPKDVASLGSKKICDPEALAQFDRLKKEAYRQCDQVGIRFLGGFAIPEDKIDTVIPTLDRISQEFGQSRRAFLNNYDQVIRDWVGKHPGFAESIRRAITPVDEVAERISFDYSIYKMKPASSAGDLTTKVKGMGDTLFAEIARDANELFDRSIAGKDQISQRSLQPIRKIRNKLDGLTFLDHRVQPVVNTMDSILQRLPTTGAITDGLFHELLATVLILSDPDKIRRHGEGKLALLDVFPAVPVRPDEEQALQTPTQTITPGGPKPTITTDSNPSSFYF